MENYYQILSVDPTASQVEIEQAANKLSSVWHDKSKLGAVSPSTKSQVLSRIKQASTILTDPVKRLEYDVKLGIRRNFSGQTQQKRYYGIPLKLSTSIEKFETIKIPTEPAYDELEKSLALSEDLSPVTTPIKTETYPNSYPEVDKPKTGLPVDLYIGPEELGKKSEYTKAFSDNVDITKKLSKEKIPVVHRRHTEPFLNQLRSQASSVNLEKTGPQKQSSVENSWIMLRSLKERTAKAIEEITDIDPNLPPFKKSVTPTTKQMDSTNLNDIETEHNKIDTKGKLSSPTKNDVVKEDNEIKSNIITTGILDGPAKDLIYTENSRKTYSKDLIPEEKRIKQHSTEQQRSDLSSANIVPVNDKPRPSRNTLDTVVLDSIKADASNDETKNFVKNSQELKKVASAKELRSESDTVLMNQAPISDTRKMVLEKSISKILQSSTGSLDDIRNLYTELKKINLKNEKHSSSQKLSSYSKDSIASQNKSVLPKEYDRTSSTAVTNESNSKIESKGNSENTSKMTANNAVKSRTSDEELQNYLEELEKLTSGIKIILDNKMRSSNDITEKRAVITDLKKTVSENYFSKLSTDFKEFLKDLNVEKETTTTTKIMPFAYQLSQIDLEEVQRQDLKRTSKEELVLKKSMTEPIYLNRAKYEKISPSFEFVKGTKSEDRYLITNHAVKVKDTEQISDGLKRLAIVKRFSSSKESVNIKEPMTINKTYDVNGIYNNTTKSTEEREKNDRMTKQQLTKKQVSKEKDLDSQTEADYIETNTDSQDNINNKINHRDSHELIQKKLPQRMTDSELPVLNGHKLRNRLRSSLPGQQLSKSHSERYLTALKLLESIAKITPDKRTTFSIDSFKKDMKDDSKTFHGDDPKVTFSDTKQVFLREESIVELPIDVKPKETMMKILEEAGQLINDLKRSSSTSDLEYILREYHRKESNTSSEVQKDEPLISSDHPSAAEQPLEKCELRAGNVDNDSETMADADVSKSTDQMKETKSPRSKHLERVEKKMVVKDWRESCPGLFPMPIKVKEDPRPPQTVSACTRIAGADLKTVYNFGPDIEFIEVYVNDELRAKIVKDQQQDVYWNTMKRDDLPINVNVCASTVISANDCIITTEIVRRGRRESIAVYKNDELLCRTGNTILDENKTQ